MAAVLPGTPSLRWQASANPAAVGSTVTSIPDSTANAYNGTTAGSVLLRAGYNGAPAYHTDGASAALVGSATIANLFSGLATQPNGWTIALVFRPDAPPVGTNVWAANNSGYTYDISRATMASNGLVTGLVESSNGVSTTSATSGAAGTVSTATPTVLLHVTGPLAQGSTTQVTSLFLNGTKFGQTASAGAPKTAVMNQFLVGAGWGVGTPTVPSSFFASEYYDVIIWPAALSDSDALSATAYLENTYVPQIITGAPKRKSRSAAGVLRQTYVASGAPVRKPRTATGTAIIRLSVRGAAVRNGRAVSSVIALQYAANGAAARKPRAVSGVLRQTYVANGTPVRKPRTATGSGVLRVGLAGAPVRKGRTATGAAILRLAIKGAAVRKGRTAASVVALQYAVNGTPARKPRLVASTFKLSLAMSGVLVRKPRTASGVAHSFLKITGSVNRKPRTSTGSVRLFLTGHGAANRSPRSVAASLSLIYRMNGAVARAPRSVIGTLTQFTLFQTKVQRHVAYGLGIAASKLGSFHTVYRPTAAMNPLQQAPLRIQLANFDGDPSFGLKRPQAWSKPIVYGMLDTTDVQVGDYLVGTDTVFVARFEPMLPPECVICSRTVSVFSSASAPPVGLDVVYGGRTDASDVMVASGWPISMVTKTRGDNVPTKLPGDVRAAYYECLIPAIPGVTLRPTMRLTDENGDDYEIVTVETSSFGNRLLVSFATN